MPLARYFDAAGAGGTAAVDFTFAIRRQIFRLSALRSLAGQGVLAERPSRVPGQICLIQDDDLIGPTLFEVANKWAQPQGYLDVVNIIIEKSAFAYSSMAVVRNERQGLVDDEVRRRMRLVAPHFRRAVAIGKVIDLHKVEAAALADTLDRITAALFLVDADRREVHANVSGQQMLREGRILRTESGGLKACDEKSDQTLQEVLAAADVEDSPPASRVVRRAAADAPHFNPQLDPTVPSVGLSRPVRQNPTVSP